MSYNLIMKNNVDPFQTDHSSLAVVITKLREEEALTKQALAQKIGCLESTMENLKMEKLSVSYCFIKYAMV